MGMAERKGTEATEGLTAALDDFEDALDGFEVNLTKLEKAVDRMVGYELMSLILAVAILILLASLL